MSNQINLDPTVYGTLPKQLDEGALRKERLKKKVQERTVVTESDMFVKLRKYIDVRYKLTMELLLHDTTPPEDIPLVRAKAQVHKEYKDMLDKVDREGLGAIEELRTSK